MRKSRVKNTILNSVVGVANYILIVIASFVVRKIFADRLGEEYLGLSSLFTSVITFLSLTELGIGSAMVFFLYKPIHDSDYQTVGKYLSFYKKAYLLIAGAILLLGTATAFVIPSFAQTTIRTDKVIVYFLLYTVNSSVSYLFAYKKSVLYADQNSKVVALVHGLTKISSNGVQILLLILTESFLPYVVSMIAFTLLDNAICAVYVNKRYPNIKIRVEERLSADERKNFFAKVTPVFLQNLCSTIVVSSDSIITSALFSVALVGLYSNYTLITQTLKTLYSQVFSAFTNSFGDLAISEEKSKCLQVYERTMFMAFFITCFCCVCFIVLIQPFIALFFGNSFVLPIEIAAAVCANYYFIGMNVPAVSVQNATGLHGKDTWVMIVQAVLNVILSIVLGKLMGLIGVVLATIISIAVCPFVSKDYVIYKYLFNAPVKKQYFRQAGYFAFTAAVCVCGYLLFDVLINARTIPVFILQAIGVTLFSLAIMTLVFSRTSGFKYYKDMIKRVLTNKKSTKKGEI